MEIKNRTAAHSTSAFSYWISGVTGGRAEGAAVPGAADEEAQNSLIKIF